MLDSAAKLERLTRVKSRNVSKETVRRAEILQLTCLLSQVPRATLRKMAAKMSEVSYMDGAYLCHEGEAADAMYVLESGSLGVYVEGKGRIKELTPGDTVGELALINREGRTATVKSQGTTQLLRLPVAVAHPLLQKVWGGRQEMERREALLLRVPLFQNLSRDELHCLCTRLTRVTFPEEGTDIVTEGKMGGNFYLIETGRAMVWVQKVGRLRELRPPDFFGELALLHHVPRTASVRTTEPTVCLSLAQPDFLRLVNSGPISQEARAAIQQGAESYGKRAALRASPLIAASVLRLWELMVEVSTTLVLARDDNAEAFAKRSRASTLWEALRRKHGQGFVNREGYTQMHLRISATLQHDFSYDDGADSAAKDWAEDITAFSGDKAVDVWLEEVKKTLKDATFKTVHSMGWHTLFERYDEDDSGSIDFEEFKTAARADLHMSEELFPDGPLRKLFEAMDDDGTGSVEYSEFSAWMAETDFSRPAAYLSEAEQKKRLDLGEELWEAMSILQIGCRERVDRLGWRAIFAKYDSDLGEDDADGELDLQEFTEIIRKECNLSSEAVPDDTLDDLFAAVDIDGTGGIDAQEFENFICSDPLAMDMTYRVFAEAMFQLVQLWVEEEDEVQYAAFLDNLFELITTDKSRTEESQDRYELVELADIVSISNPDGGISMEGVKTKNPSKQPEPFSDDPDSASGHRGSDLHRQGSKHTDFNAFELSQGTSRTKSSGQKKTGPGPWTSEEESLLLTLVSDSGVGDWMDKANKLGTGRTAAAVSTKYFSLMKAKGANGDDRKQASAENNTGLSTNSRPANEVTGQAHAQLSAPTEQVKEQAVTKSPAGTEHAQQTVPTITSGRFRGVLPKPEGWFKVPALGSRDSRRINWHMKQPALPPRQSRQPTVAKPFRLSNRTANRQERKESSARQARAENKVSVHLKSVVNWTSAERPVRTGTSSRETPLFFSPLDSAEGSQSARSHPFASSEAQHCLVQHAHTARSVVTGGGGMLAANTRQPQTISGTVHPPMSGRRRPDPISLPSEISNRALPHTASNPR